MIKLFFNEIILKYQDYIMKSYKNHKDYLNIEWKEIQIINGQNKYYSVPGRFRISDHNFEFQFNNKTCELYPHFTKAVYQDEKVYVPFLTNFGEIEDYQFFQPLSVGAVNLLKKVSKNGNNSSSNLYFQTGNDKKAYPLKKKRKAVAVVTIILVHIYFDRFLFIHCVI